MFSCVTRGLEGHWGAAAALQRQGRWKATSRSDCPSIYSALIKCMALTDFWCIADGCPCNVYGSEKPKPNQCEHAAFILTVGVKRKRKKRELLLSIAAKYNNKKKQRKKRTAESVEPRSKKKEHISNAMLTWLRTVAPRPNAAKKLKYILVKKFGSLKWTNYKIQHWTFLILLFKIQDFLIFILKSLCIKKNKKNNPKHL